MNTITTFAGNLTEDPDLRFTTTGAPVASLRVAVNRRVKKNDEYGEIATSLKFATARAEKNRGGKTTNPTRRHRPTTSPCWAPGPPSRRSENGTKTREGPARSRPLFWATSRKVSVQQDTIKPKPPR